MRWLLPATLISTLHAAPVLVESGDLQADLEATNIPSEFSNDKYQLPSQAQLDAFRAALEHILEGDLPSAANEAETANYDLVSYTDNVTADTFAILREKNSNQHWGGLYVVDLTPERALVVQSPHPLYDGVRVAAIDVFMDTGAVAFFQAGTHRNNSLTPGNCDGTLNGEAYRISDMAHAPASLFQAAHVVLENHFDQTVSLNFHGMADDSDDADVVISNGTSDTWIGNSLSRDLAFRMNEIILADDPMDLRYAVSHQEPGEDPNLSGSTNTQGRATNGSTNTCTVAATTAIFLERFIHLEADPDVRNGQSSNWSFVTQALNDLIPLFSDPDPGLPVGSLVITEIMPHPDQVFNSVGEYIELFNQTGSPITMTDWIIVDDQDNQATFSGVIQPGALFVVGVSGDLNGGEAGGAPDAVWSDTVGDMTLTNTRDVISIIDDNGDFVTSIAYDDGDPFGAGVSLELVTANQHPSGQTLYTVHVPDQYVASQTPFGNDLGSPGTRGQSQFPLPPVNLTPTLTGGDIELSFPTTPAVTYTLWDSPDLDTWNEVQGESPIIGDGLDADFTFLRPNDDQYFYRIDYDYPAPE
ncbi:MAG: lamin tail domain-containing protein [Haloferula sp.]